MSYYVSYSEVTQQSFTAKVDLTSYVSANNQTFHSVWVFNVVSNKYLYQSLLSLPKVFCFILVVFRASLPYQFGEIKIFSITRKLMIPKCSNLYREWPWDIREVSWFRVSRSQVMDIDFCIARPIWFVVGWHWYNIDTGWVRTLWVPPSYLRIILRAAIAAMCPVPYWSVLLSYLLHVPVTLERINEEDETFRRKEVPADFDK